MADWYGTSRTNMVYIDNLDGLKESLEPFDITIDEREDGSVLFSSRESCNGDFPAFGSTDEDEELEFSWEEHVMPFVKEGEVLIVMSSGAVKYQYVTGYADAYVRKGSDVQSIGLDLNHIYDLASEKLGIFPRTRAEY